MSDTATAFSTLLGQRLRALREGGGKRQEELAAAARHYGLSWSRATLAALETGRRQLSVGELFLLPAVLNRLALGRTGKEAPASGGLLVADLLPERGDQWVALTPRTSVRVRVLRTLLGTAAEPMTEQDFDTPHRRQTTMAQASLQQSIRDWSEQTETTWRRIMGRPLSGSDLPTLNQALEDADGVVEQQAARRLRVPARAIALAARKRWNSSLTEQRDRRLAEALRGDPSARRLQALRGHHTRALLFELRPLLRAVRGSRRRRKRRGFR
jgi:transcriptional regulator with XRE-family HTH domain